MTLQDAANRGNCSLVSRAKADHENSLWKKCVKRVYNFFDNTSVHGVKYLAEFRRPYIERGLWLVSIILSIIACGYLISRSWEVRSSSPVILAMDKKQRAVWEIPFPAITICPTDKIRSSKGLTHQQENEVLCAMNLVCERNFPADKCPNTSDVIRALITSAPKPDEIFVSTPHIAMAILLGVLNVTAQPVLANGGLCYSINMFPGSAMFANKTFHKSEKFLDYKENVNWDIEDGYKNKIYPSSYPRPALGSGADAGLLVLLKNEAVFNASCTFIHGFELQVHNPVDFPSGEQKYYAPLNSMVQVFVKPEEVITDDLRAYTPDQRQCYYPDEHKLQFFSVYTQKNCELECFSKVTLKCCGCAAYYMPRHEDTPVCLTKDQLLCISNARARVIANASGVQYTGVQRCANTEVKCKCLPSCTHVRYHYQVAHTKMDRRQLEEIYRDEHGVSDIEDCDFTIIQIFYTESHFIPFRRLELYGTVEFLANCGGVLGLCLGVSVLSIIELLYWLLVRPFCRTSPVQDVPKEAEATHLTSL